VDGAKTEVFKPRHLEKGQTHSFGMSDETLNYQWLKRLDE
jgi:hypothetical protein